MFLLLAIFAALALPYHPHTGWNVNTRLNLVFAVVDQRTLSIDGYHDLEPYATGDKAVFEGHYYSDKIFGVSLLALPFYAVGRSVAGGPMEFHAAHYLMKTFAVALPGAISAALFFLILARLGCPPRRAVVLTALAVFGTLWAGYGTVFYPYIPGLAASLGALYLIFFPLAQRLTAANSTGIGFLLGYALLCDLIFGLLVFALGVIWLLRVLDQVGVVGLRAFAQTNGERSRLKHAIAYSAAFWLGVLVPLSLFAAYCYTIFGRFGVPYEYEADPLFRAGMAQGIMGVTLPKLSNLYHITLHPYRGIFFWSPLALLAVGACAAATTRYGKRAILGWLGLWSLIAYLLFNAGYYMWWGGWSMGSRFLVPMLPFLMLPLGEFAREDKLSFLTERVPNVARQVWPVVIFTGLLGILMTLPLSLTEPQIPQGNPTEVLQSARFGEAIEIPQFSVLQAFYLGNVTLWPWERMRGNVATESVPLNVLSIAAYLVIVGGLLAVAWRKAPTQLPGLHRNDYPFATVDGSAAPAPPKRGSSRG